MKNLPEGWIRAPLSDLVDVLDSLRVPVSRSEREKRAGEVPYYGATGQVGWIDEPIFNEDLILLGEDGVQFFDATKSKAYLISGPAWVNNHAHVLRPREEVIDRHYLCYYLNSFDYRGYANGTTRLKLTQAAMNSIPIELPPFAEQRRIVAALEDHLSRIDAGLGLLRDSETRIRAFKKAIFSHAVQGLAASRSVDDGDGRALLDQLLILRAALVHRRRATPAPPASGSTMHIPSHWTMASMDQLCWDIQYGTSAKAHTGPKDGDIPVLRMGNIQDGAISWDSLKYLPAGHPDASALRLADGDLLFNRTNSAELVGKSAVYRENMGPATFASYLIRCRLIDGVEPDWVNLVINSFHGRSYVRSVVTQQVGQANVNGTKLAAMPIPLPPHGEQVRILASVAEQNMGVKRLGKATNEASIRASHLRRSLLVEAFNGRLVPQDPADEPASVLLERIKAKRAAAQAPKRRARRTRPKATDPMSERDPQPEASARPIIDIPIPSPTASTGMPVQETLL